VPFTWHASSTTESFDDIKYPGILAQCETCHVPGSYDFSATASAAALPGKQFRTVVTGTPSPAAGSVAEFSQSPYVVSGTAYGSGYSFNVGTGLITEAAATTLVNSPIATACFSCHDSTLARQHMESNGGSIYAARSTALAKGEQCMLCHASGKVADIKVMHSK